MYKPSWRTGEGWMYYGVIIFSAVIGGYVVYTAVAMQQQIVLKALELATTGEDIDKVSLLAKGSIVETLKPLVALAAPLLAVFKFGTEQKKHKEAVFGG